LKSFFSLCVGLPTVLSFPASAATWDIAPTLSAGETYTDNLSLSPESSKQSDWVTQVTPAISLAATGAQSRFKVNYALDVTYYARGHQENQVYNRLDAAGHAELAKQLIFVDAGAHIDQYNVSLLAPLATSNVNTTGNSTTVKSFFASPYFRRDFGSDVRGELRLTESVVSSNQTSTLSDSVADRIDLQLKSGPAHRLLAWNVQYARETIDYKNAQDSDTELVTADARRLISPSVGLLVQAGYEYYRSGEIGPASEGPSWSAGFDWTPSPQTRLRATAGQRFYGDTYLLDFSHRTRLTTWSVGYNENITSTRSEFFVPATTSTAGYLDTLFSSQFPDSLARQKAVEQFIARTGLPPGLGAPVDFFSTDLFLVKRLQASAGILGAKNVLIGNVFKESREALIGNLVLPGTGDFAASNTIRQTGTTLLWNWRVTVRNALNLRGAYGRNEFPDIGRIDHLTYIGMGFTRQFQSRLFGSLNYRQQHNDSNQSQFDYTEHAVFASLQLRL
jgi:uncharacterized protein (PEP-CTERM system associated)